MKNFFTTKTERNLFLFTILLFAFIRFWNISERGIYYHDEAAFIGNAKFYGDLGRYFVEKAITFNLSFSELVNKAYDVWREGANPWQNARPLMYTFYIMVAFISGHQELPCILVSALANFLIFFVIKETKCFKYNYSYLISMALLGSSIWNLQYARSALSQSLSLLLISLVIKKVIDYNNANEKTAKELYTISLLTGFAFTTHYNLFWLPVFIGIWQIYILFKELNIKEFITKISLSAIFMTIPLIIFEIPSYIVMKVTSRYIHDPVYSKAFLSYLNQVYFQITWFNGKEDALISSKTFFFEWFIEYEGVIFVLILSIGIIFLLFKAFKGNKNSIFLAFMFFLPLIIWNSFGFPAPRSFVPMLIPACLAFGLFIDFLYEKFTNKAYYIITTTAFILFLNLYINSDKIISIINAKSPYKTIAQEIINFNNTKDGIIISNKELNANDKPILRFYLKKLVNKDIEQGNIFISDLVSNNELKELSDIIAHKYEPNFSIEQKLENGMILEDGFPHKYLKEYKSNENNYIKFYYLKK